MTWSFVSPAWVRLAWDLQARKVLEPPEVVAARYAKTK
jgi:hypothetical protein